MVTPGSVPKPVVVLLGENKMVAPELFVEMLPEMAPFGSVPPDPGGVEFTLMVKSRPETLTLVPVPVVVIFPRLMMLGVTTPEPEPALYENVIPPIVTEVVLLVTQPATPLQLSVEPVVL
jgi:hypothetical protein